MNNNSSKKSAAQLGSPKIPSDALTDDDKIAFTDQSPEDNVSSDQTNQEDDGYGDFSSPLDGLDEDAIFDSSGIDPLDFDSEDDSLHSPLHRSGLPRNLNAPKPRDGYRQKFVLFYDRSGRILRDSIARAKRTGWIPRKVSPGEFSQTGRIGSSTVIEIQGHVLCEMPEERALRRTEMIRQQTSWNSQAIGADMKAEGSRMQTRTGFKEDITVRHGSRTGRKVQVAPDRNDG
jgi:hypothetical protein